VILDSGGIGMSSTLDSLTDILKELNKTGRVKASIVATDEGFVIASAVSRGVDEKVAAAMGSFVFNTADRAKDELKLGMIRDITIRCEKGSLVCKSTLLEDGRPVVLAALIPRNTRFYIRQINKTLRKIREVLRELEV
jgi:predicted regulator of Ras-like GTPase activity (Roadblock/LC7/MglB family)